MNKIVRFLLWTAFALAVVVGLARLLAIRWWTVPSGDEDPYLTASLAPTLREGDVVLLWRLTKPGFGDLVVCPEPGHPEREVVGRIVAETDDTLTIRGREVFLNKRRISSERHCADDSFTVTEPNTGREIEQPCEIENLEGIKHKRGSFGEHRVRPLKVTKKVGPNQVFLLSDNRLLPWDSRDYGTVDRRECHETVVFRLLGKRGLSDSDSRFTVIR